MKRSDMFLTLIVLAVIAAGSVIHLNSTASAQPTEQQKLGVLWTSGDPEVAHKVCLMYTHAAASGKWFDQVQLIVWGPSSKLLSTDAKLQAKIKAMIKDGIDVKACKACADMYGVSDDLAKLGIEVKYMGKPLSQMLQSDWKILTF